MGGLDGAGVRRILLRIGVVVVAALWIAEDMGWIHVAESGIPLDADLPSPVPTAMGLTVQSVMVGHGTSAGIAMLSDNGQPPEMVSEGQAYHDDLRIERVLADRVILRKRDNNAPIVLAVVPPRPMGDVVPPPVTPMAPIGSTPTVEPPTGAAAAAPGR